MTEKIDTDSRTAIYALEELIKMHSIIISRLKKREIVAIIPPGMDEKDISNIAFLPTEGNTLYPPFKEHVEGN